MNESLFEAVLLDAIVASPKFCDVCGAGLGTRLWHEGHLYVCELCDLPADRRITPEETKIWKGLMHAKAGEQCLRNMLGHKVSHWFLERYARLGLHR